MQPCVKMTHRCTDLMRLTAKFIRHRINLMQLSSILVRYCVKTMQTSIKTTQRWFSGTRPCIKTTQRCIKKVRRCTAGNQSCGSGLSTPALIPAFSPGEGETFAASLEYRATGLAGWTFADQKTGSGMSSPWGEETGEAGRKNKWIGPDAKRLNSSRSCKPASGVNQGEFNASQ